MKFIFNICCLVAVFIGFFATIRFWKNYKETGILQFKYFSILFFFIFLGYTLLSLPNLILFNPSWIQIDFILVDISFAVGGLFSTPATLSFIKYSDRVKKMFSWLLPLLIVTYIILNIFFFAPATPLCPDGICYWKNGVFWLHSIMWLPFASGIGLIGVWFLFGARKIKEKQLFRRSFLFGLMGISIFIAGILFWYFKFFNPSSKLLITSGIIGDLGFLFGVIGSFLYQYSREPLVKKIT
ncbi:MAG: hypothetical protein V1868_02730 [Patescibacteria group bacterium]|nr:hypothetical protein [Patescibacteria group bacterium]